MTRAARRTLPWLLLWKSPRHWRTDKLYISGQLEADYCQHVSAVAASPHAALTPHFSCFGGVCRRRKDLVQRRVRSHPALALPCARQDRKVPAPSCRGRCRAPHSALQNSLSLGVLHFQAVAWSDFITKQAWFVACSPPPSSRSSHFHPQRPKRPPSSAHHQVHGA